MGLLASTGLLKTAVVLTDAVYGALTLSLALSRRQKKPAEAGFFSTSPTSCRVAVRAWSSSLILSDPC
ncbi:hypothetical protein D3C86_1555320 [compost metagenome]